MTLFLEGLRVIEASAFVAAPLSGLILAELGADVIRVDPIQGSLDRHRWPLGPDGRSLYWAGLNRGKRSAALDIGDPVGRELLASVVCAPGTDAGILVSNLSLHGKLSYPELKRRRDDVIVIRIVGDRRGHNQVDYTVNASVGFPLVTGGSGAERPVNNVTPAWDIATGTLTATALLGAVLRRQRTGEGAYVEIALEDVALAAVGYLGRMSAVQLGVAPQERDGNAIYGSFGRDFVSLDDRRLMVTALTPHQWRALRVATDTGDELEQLAARLGMDFDNEGDRYEARHEIAEILERAFAARSGDEIEARLEKAGACWSWYRTFEEAVHEEVARANPLLAELVDPSLGSYLAPGSPVQVDGRASFLGAAPEQGAHTREILTEILGLGEADLVALSARGIIR